MKTLFSQTSGWVQTQIWPIRNFHQQCLMPSVHAAEVTCDTSEFVHASHEPSAALAGLVAGTTTQCEPPKLTIAELLNRYGGGMLIKQKTNTVNFRAPEVEECMLKELSKRINLSMTLTARLAFKMILECPVDKEELLNRYGGAMLAASNALGCTSNPINVRIPFSEHTELKAFAARWNLTLTIVARMAIYLLNDELEP